MISPNTDPDANDFAGIFAANTSGVFVGILPTSSSMSDGPG